MNITLSDVLWKEFVKKTVDDGFRIPQRKILLMIKEYLGEEYANKKNG
ncbi:MAG: hypothetical protein ACREBJ_10325 [Nitrosotalea sp.]